MAHWVQQTWFVYHIVGPSYGSLLYVVGAVRASPDIHVGASSTL
jgi:hypothetical protein